MNQYAGHGLITSVSEVVVSGKVGLVFNFVQSLNPGNLKTPP